MKIKAGKRSRDVFRAPAAERVGREAVRECARGEVRGALALAEIEAKRAYVLAGFPSAEAWARSVGYGPRQAYRLLDLGRSLQTLPELVGDVREARVPAESAAVAGRVVRELKLRGAGRTLWIEKARTIQPIELRREADKTIEDARQRAQTVRFSLHVTKQTLEGFQRARILLSKGERRMLTEGQAFGRVVEHFLDHQDPRRKPLPRRRAGRSTAGRRYTPPRERAQVERRSGGVCECCGERRAVEKHHLRVRRTDGGTWDLGNIVDVCWDCHVLLEAGTVLFLRFGDDGKPVFGPSDGGGLVRERGPPAYAFALG